MNNNLLSIADCLMELFSIIANGMLKVDEISRNL